MRALRAHKTRCSQANTYFNAITALLSSIIIFSQRGNKSRLFLLQCREQKPFSHLKVTEKQCDVKENIIVVPFG